MSEAAVAEPNQIHSGYREQMTGQNFTIFPKFLKLKSVITIFGFGM